MSPRFLLVPILLLASLLYVGWRIFQVVPLPLWGRVLCVCLYAALFGAVFLSFRLDSFPMAVSRSLYMLGNTYLIFFLYLLLGFLLLDLLSLCRIIPGSWLRDSLPVSLGLYIFLTVLLLAGHVHYLHKYREEIALTTPKPLGGKGDVRFVLVSDLHLGYHNGAGELSRWVDMINAEEPDAVLVAGDIIDMSPRPLFEEDMASVMRRLKCPVYTIPGNHEYYSGIEDAMRFMESSSVTVLRDSVASVCGVTVVGRDDRTNPARRSLRSLMQDAPGVDSTFTILLDHQPYDLPEAEACGIDFQFSGHTHHGQVWPGNWVTDAMYENAFGRSSRGGTTYYVSSGLGIWGATVRIGTRSEYVVLRISSTST